MVVSKSFISGLIGWVGFSVMLILWFQGCGNNITKIGSSASAITATSITTTPVFDKKTYTVPMKVQKPKDSIVYVPTLIYSKIDSAAVFKTYFTTYYYSQAIEDSNMCAMVYDTIRQNKIVGMGFKYQWLKPVSMITVTNVIESNKRLLMVGVFAGASVMGTQLSCGPKVSFLTKKNTIYDASYDVFGKVVMIGASKVIQFK